MTMVFNDVQKDDVFERKGTQTLPGFRQKESKENTVPGAEKIWNYIGLLKILQKVTVSESIYFSDTMHILARHQP